MSANIKSVRTRCFSPQHSARSGSFSTLAEKASVVRLFRSTLFRKNKAVTCTISLLSTTTWTKITGYSFHPRTQMAKQFLPYCFGLFNENQNYWSAAKLTARVMGCLLDGLCSSIMFIVFRPVTRLPGLTLAMVHTYRIGMGAWHLLSQR
jgi:hypothetical protein